MSNRALRVLFITPNFNNNSLGRTYCLWLLARELGWTARVAGVKGGAIWPPLSKSPFALDCILPEHGGSANKISEGLRAQIEWCDVVVAVKILPTSFGIGSVIAHEVGRPVVLDIDDPDVEVRTMWRPWRERLPRLALSQSYRRRERDLYRLKRLAARYPRMVSNPVLQRIYGGSIVPHVRAFTPPIETIASGCTTVRFVGSVGAHKGVQVLRAAVDRLADRGFRLGVTAPAPEDAKTWEDWYGMTSMEEGRRLVATADIIAVPSLPIGWAKAQLPAKLIDAMVEGRALIASDIEPMRWAIDDESLLVAPGDIESLAAGLLRLRDPVKRAEIGRRMRARAEVMFSVAVNAERFHDVVDQALLDEDNQGSNGAALG